MSFPKYPKYKDSGVAWLGEVPEHWGSFPLKYIATIKTGYAFSSDDFIEEGIPVLRIGDINTEGKVDLSKAQFLPDNYSVSNSDVLVKKGDIVMAMTGATIGKAGLYLEPYPSLLNQRVCLFRVKQPNLQGYLWWILTAAFYADHITLESVGGAQPNISDYKLLQCAIPTPSSIEQTLISTFLDAETAKIDTLVSEQKRLIELLKEKRQAVISQAVTKGLNPDVPMKDSGVEWLGAVPEGWEVKPMRMIANIVRGASPRPAGDPRYFGGDEVPWVTVAEITKNNSIYLTETESFLTQEGSIHSNLFSRGTLIYSNSGATLGVPKILSLDACANDGVVAFLNLSNEVNAEFLFHYLASITDSIREKVRQGSGQPNLNTDIVKNLRFGLPPLGEQDVIVTRIAELINQFDTLTTEAHRAIALLQERRTALISAAVTGQIDVRNYIV